MKNRYFLFLALLILSGCDSSGGVQTYRLEKEKQPDATALSVQPVPQGRDGKPAEWKTPQGWIEQPASEMRVGSFRAPGRDERVTDVSIIPLGAMAGTDLQNINRWRGQINLDPVSEADLKGLIEKKSLGGRKVSYVSMASRDLLVDGKFKKRLAAGWFEERGRFWFVKMMGEDSDVQAATPALLELIASIRLRP